MVWHPIEIPVFEHIDSVRYLEVYTVEKAFIECELCHTRVNTTKEAVERFPHLPMGYALLHSSGSPDKPHDILLKVICEECRRKRYPDTPVLKSLKAAKKAIDRNHEAGGR
jgi:hypothetical protein